MHSEHSLISGGLETDYDVKINTWPTILVLVRIPSETCPRYPAMLLKRNETFPFFFRDQIENTIHYSLGTYDL